MRFDMRWRSRAVLMLAGALLSGACTDGEHAAQQQDGEPTSPPAAAGRAGKTYVYECSDGLRFTARIEGEKAWLFLPSGTIDLPHVEAASGAKYSDGAVTLWTKGESAMLERENQPRTECKNDRAQAIWEDAKLRGADFRATGNEPGWYLEISAQYGIVFVKNYGADRYHFKTYQSDIDETSRRTVFTASDGSSELQITLEGRNCVDSMSGEQFETAVTVVMDGDTLTGCGRPLH